MLRFVVMCGDGVIANGRGGIGAAAVECVETCAGGGGACKGDDAVGVAKAVGNDRVVVAAAAVDGGAESEGVGDAGSKGGIAAAAGVALAVGVVGVEGTGGVVVVGGVAAASLAICGGGIEGASGVDEAGDVVGGVAAVAVAVDIAGACGTDGAGIVDDVYVAVAVVVGGVIFIVKVQSWVSGREVGAKEASVGGRARGAGRYEVTSAETSREAAVTARAGMLSEVFVIIDGLDGCVCAVRVSGKGVG